MGCCIPTKGKKIVIKSNIPMSNTGSVENEKQKILQKDSNANVVSPDQKMKSDKTFDPIIQKEKNKVEKKNIKSMNALKEISQNEVCDCAKYF